MFCEERKKEKVKKKLKKRSKNTKKETHVKVIGSGCNKESIALLQTTNDLK